MLHFYFFIETSCSCNKYKNIFFINNFRFSLEQCSVCLFYQALDTVPLNCISEFLIDCNAYFAFFCIFTFKGINNNVFTNYIYALTESTGKLPVLLNCKNFTHIAPLKEKPPSGGLSTRLVRESCSSFCLASLEHFSAIGSLHSFAEAMLHFSLTLFGLVCSLHCHCAQSLLTVKCIIKQVILYNNSMGFVNSFTKN